MQRPSSPPRMGGRRRRWGRSADLIYHLTVMMAQQNIPLEAVLEELDRRSHKIGNLKQFHVADHNT